VGFGKGAANDSPVQVPNGSLSALTGSSWTKDSAYQNVYESTLDFNPDVLHLDGINEDKPHSQFIEEVWIKNITSNWTITLDYRDSTGKTEDQYTKLQICTHIVDSAISGEGVCDPTPSQTSLGTSKTIYMAADPNNKTGAFVGPSPDGGTTPDERGIDGDRYILHYNLSSPTKDGKPGPVGKDSEPLCNHLFEIRVSQLKTAWWDFWTKTGQRQYHCVDGKCDIWIGKENRSK
jgi:hypothetical protein